MLPGGWRRSGMLDAAHRADGPRHHLDIGVTLPPLDGATIQADSLISSPDSWRLYLRARPGWWNYSTEDHSRRSRFSVHAEDDLGGLYLAEFDGYTGRPFQEEEEEFGRDHAGFALRFLPRLDPFARALKLTCKGASEEVALHIGLAPVAAP